MLGFLEQRATGVNGAAVGKNDLRRWVGDRRHCRQCQLSGSLVFVWRMSFVFPQSRRTSISSSMSNKGIADPRSKAAKVCDEVEQILLGPEYVLGQRVEI